jgi:phospholipase C
MSGAHRRGPTSVWRVRRKLLIAVVLVVVIAAAGCSSSSPAANESAGSSDPTGTTSAPSGNPIGHVFVINLENKGYDETWGPASVATYLNGTLRPQGQLLEQYYGIGHFSLDNYLAEISGQAPNPTTQSDCPQYVEFNTTGVGADGQALGSGCVYPSSVKTVADQLDAAGKTWKAYQEDMANSATEPTTCRHPAIGAADTTLAARPGDMYATRHDPFVYFHSVIDSPSCAANVVDFTAMATDLASVATTPNLSFITPNLCHDGHDAPCVNSEKGGLVSSDAWLQAQVPAILDSPAFKQDGLLIITFDEAEVVGTQADATACCNTPPSPNAAMPGQTGPGGGRVGALVIGGPIKPDTSNPQPYNHYALLCSIEDVF